MVTRVLLLALLLSACTASLDRYVRAFDPGFTDSPCAPGEHGPNGHLTAYGRTLVSLCATDLEVLFHDLVFDAEPREFWVGDGPAWSPSGRAALRYAATGKRSVGDTATRLDFDVVLTFDDRLQPVVLGLVSKDLPLTGSPFEETIDVHLGSAQPTAATAWAKDPGEFYGRLGPPPRGFSERSVKMRERADTLAQDFSTLRTLTPAICGALRYLALDTRRDEFDARGWIGLMLGDRDAQQRDQLVARLKDPVERCTPETFAALDAAFETKAKRSAEFLAGEAQRKAESDARYAEMVKVYEARLAEVRARAEQLALRGQTFTALALLGWWKSSRSVSFDAFAAPAREVPLRAGLGDDEFADALRTTLYRKYWTRLTWSAGGAPVETTRPRNAPRPPPHTITATATLPDVSPEVTSSSDVITWWSEGEEVDRTAVAQSEASRRSASASARPLLERLEAIDGRLSRIEERLQGPKLQVGATPGSSVSRMQQVCEPVPGGPPKCVNKWSTFTADGPMKSNGGLAPWEADDLREERGKLSDERAELVKRLEALGAQAKAPTGPAPTRKTRTLHSQTIPTHRYRAEKDFAVATARDGKPWERLTARLELDAEVRNTPLTPQAIRELVEDRARARTGDLLEERWLAWFDAQLARELPAALSSEERERELSLAHLYLDARESADFLKYSLGSIGPLVQDKAAP
ncbi:MAG: hypothetical protein K1X89_07115 [Myxococcaceae bacterium]|nr:hypothetical protein [Myxococcaceae bacterium]